MRVTTTRLEGPRLFEPAVHGDARGFFLESFRADLFETAGIDITFVQDNHSRSRRGIARGMHFQPGQSKLVRVVRGAILDVIVDIRSGSPTFGEWESFELDDISHHQLFVPDGFAHGFAVTSELADVAYKVNTYYDPDSEAGFRFDDPAVGIQWPLPAGELQVSVRDQTAPTLAEITADLASLYPAAS